MATIRLPTYPFERHAELASNPFASELLSSSAVADVHGEDQRSKTVVRTLLLNASNLAF